MSLWIVGCGDMAKEYAKVLSSMGVTFRVIGRSLESAKKFEVATGIPVVSEGLQSALDVFGAPESAIVAVGVEMLSDVSQQLIRSGTRRILLEKPGGLNIAQICSVHDLAAEFGAEVYIGYNRRFYASTKMLDKLVEEDGGVLSCNFEFTEWSHIISPLKKVNDVKKAWFLANSSHVVDLFIYFCGLPKNWQAWRGGSLEWHPSAARFCGAGVSEKGILFSYKADWEAPGRWGIELLTRRSRFVLQPIEELKIMKLGSVQIEEVPLEDQIDKKFKPGLYMQTKEFLEHKSSRLLRIDQHLHNCKIYDMIAGYDLEANHHN